MPGMSWKLPPAEGSYVSPGSTVLSFADLRTLWAEAQLYVSDLPFLAQSREASVTLPYYPGRILSGKVSFVNPNLEAASKIVLTRVEISNPSGEYQPGMQAWITLKGKTRRTLAVPTNALIQESRGTTVWIKMPMEALKAVWYASALPMKIILKSSRGIAIRGNRGRIGAYLLNSELVFKKGSDPMAGHKM